MQKVIDNARAVQDWDRAIACIECSLAPLARKEAAVKYYREMLDKAVECLKESIRQCQL